MKATAWAIMFMIPWPHSTIDKLVIYTFPSEEECVETLPDVKRKHRLFFKDINCVSMVDDLENRPPILADASKDQQRPVLADVSKEKQVPVMADASKAQHRPVMADVSGIGSNWMTNLYAGLSALKLLMDVWMPDGKSGAANGAVPDGPALRDR